MRKKNGFTLVELLVVITIITILAGFMIPGIGKAMKQAKGNRALSEMQHLSTVITQIYSELGYYVRLEDLPKSLNTDVRRWESMGTSDYTAEQADGTIPATHTLDSSAGNNVLNMWAGPYTTYKNFATADPNVGGPALSYRPIDPWGDPSAADTSTGKRLNQYRMFWTTDASVIPVGATGAMVIISAGPDKKYQCNITPGFNPVTATTTQFAAFAPTSANKGDDVYYIFNAGIQ